MKALLKRDILAVDLAMDAPDGEGYPADHVIGRAGTQVRICQPDDDLGEFGDGYVEVDEFSEDPFAIGWINQEDLEILLDI